MAIMFNSIIGPMLEAVKGTFENQWPTIKDFAESETIKLAQTLTQISQLVVTEQISNIEASVLLEIQKNTARTVILTVEGMGLILVEEAINSALDAVSGVINTALGFDLV